MVKKIFLKVLKEKYQTSTMVIHSWQYLADFYNEHKSKKYIKVKMNKKNSLFKMNSFRDFK